LTWENEKDDGNVLKNKLIRSEKSLSQASTKTSKNNTTEKRTCARVFSLYKLHNAVDLRYHEPGCYLKPLRLVVNVPCSAGISRDVNPGGAGAIFNILTALPQTPYLHLRAGPD